MNRVIEANLDYFAVSTRKIGAPGGRALPILHRLDLS
jgi:hypothetical protein